MSQTTVVKKMRPPGGHEKSAAQVTPDSRVSLARPTFRAHQAVAKKGPLVFYLLPLSTQRNWLLVVARQPHAVDSSSTKTSADTLFELKFFISCYEMNILERASASRAPTFSRSSVAGQPPCVARECKSP